jgi:hypothetical protein
LKGKAKKENYVPLFRNSDIVRRIFQKAKEFLNIVEGSVEKIVSVESGEG